jgi:hypothetical protein
MRKQFGLGEKAKVMAWFYKGILAKEIDSRLHRDVSGIRKVMNQNKALLLTATPPPPKERSGRLSVSTNREVERLGGYFKRFPFKTVRQLKAEVNGWSNISVHTMQKVGQKKLKMPSRSAAKKASVHSKDGEEEAAILQKVQVLGGKRLGKSHVFERIDFQAGEPKGPEGEAALAEQPLQAEVRSGQC